MKHSITSPRQAFAALLAVVALTCLNSCKSTQVAAPQMASAQATAKVKPIPMILDSDFGSSTDDLFALMMLHHYIDDGRVDLKGIIVDREGEKNAGVVDIFNNYYGHPDIPIGLERNGVKNPRCFIPYNGICDLTEADGTPMFKTSINPATLSDGYRLYRQILSKADDKSVVIVAIGFATTLAQLIQSTADQYSPLSGRELLDKKVKAIYIQSGRFEAGDSLSGYNMRAASKQSAIFYDQLPTSVDLIMSPSNIGDAMNYLPGDVLSDLSYTTHNPIKAVYSNYHCDTGQRMWDTNCLVNAVLGDEQYYLSPRGYVTFVDRGEESLMLFRQDPNGNARYQLPGDSYFNQEKLMDIRRHTRMYNNRASYSIEAPQPQLTNYEATQWVKPRMTQLIDKYLGTAGNTLNPDDVRATLRPIGYIGSNEPDYKQAEQLLTDNIYTTMLNRAIKQGKTDMVIITGPPASGKTTAAKQLKLNKAGLIYDADLSDPQRLENAIAQAQKAGMRDINIVMVYNDILTCYKNCINRGKTQWRFTPLDQLIASFRNNSGKIDHIQATYPNIKITPIDCTNNQGVRQTTLDAAKRWNFNPTDADIKTLLTYLLEQINSGNLQSYEIAQAAGKVLAIPGLNAENQALARQIDEKIREVSTQSR